MMKWFEGNPVAIGLALAIGFMLVISLAIGVVWSFPPRAADPGLAGDGTVAQLNIPELENSEPIEAYAVISERPVFNDTRLPVIEEELATEEEPEEEEVDAPDVQLSGVIITPTMRMVTLKSAELNESLVAFEGQPLEGDFGTWQVSQIRAREVTLSSAAGESLQLKLEVHDRKISEPPKPVAPKKEGQDAPAPQSAESSNEPLSRAEEIRQRIAERREELRRAAEDKDESEEPEVDYRSAIQSMVNGSERRKTNEDGNRD
ncbi:hypothetical protein ACFL0N_04560 [Pseudomonadota bacterium]